MPGTRPREELSVLAAFAVVADERSFTRAAVRLGVSTSAVSHSIRALEERLGVRLLARTTRTVAPTDAGQHLLEQLRPALGEIEAALTEVGRLPRLSMGVRKARQAGDRLRLRAPHRQRRRGHAPCRAGRPGTRFPVRGARGRTHRAGEALAGPRGLVPTLRRVLPVFPEPASTAGRPSGARRRAPNLTALRLKGAGCRPPSGLRARTACRREGARAPA